MTEQIHSPTRFTISEAARWVGKNRKTIQRRINDGTMSAKEDKQGRKYIGAEELQRVYPEDFKVPETLDVASTTHDTVGKNGHKSHEVPSDRTEFLQDQVKLLENQVEELKQDKAHLREDWKKEVGRYEEREKEYRSQIKQYMALLPPPAEADIEESTPIQQKDGANGTIAAGLAGVSKKEQSTQPQRETQIIQKRPGFFGRIFGAGRR